MNDLFEKTVLYLKKHNIENSRLETRMIFGFVSGVDYAQISGREEFSSEQEEKIKKIAEERANGKPMDKILGVKSFYKNDFIVDENVLSPRPDTEILVEKAIEIIKKYKLKNLLDMGIGSGCILFSIVEDCSEINGVGIDTSDKALRIAEKNRKKLGLQDRTGLAQKSWNDSDFTEFFSDKFDIIVSNPPYIPQKDEKTLMPEVINYDPAIALFGGNDGLDEYRNIAKKAPQILKDDGWLLLEVGITQAEDVRQIFEKERFLYIETVKDLAGIERCIIFKKIN